ncbi:hypothetical protein H310_04617 [Aphanomyces invadans]|uniref:Cilia- and flagella-associated protein 45 n=1 Tax=Aphanomyces invadans TaxID=157072 RepID=A0A024UDF4_9STRA|nr:hypothetical protein H310_04617 [Aphanomyces invadans]ETW04309.1 hypothetical protein H310_04617 [Aphanomyces invadans]|eukprot:XP_008867265.1 hypothetical protein H310_04617 [Aphanomyces invadans]
MVSDGLPRQTGRPGRSNIGHAGKTISTPAHATSIVRSEDLERIRLNSTILTDEDLARLAKESEQTKVASRALAQDRKNRMVEKELQVRARREQYATQMELDAERTSVLTKADLQRVEHLDDVKHIQSLVAKAIAATGCDAQRLEKEETRQFEASYNQRIERVMESDRIAELRERERAAGEAREKRVDARKMLEGQINERLKQQIREEEAKAIEAKKILMVYKQYEIEEEAKVAAHRVQVQATIAQIAATNADIKAMKAEAARREAHEEQVAARYLREKAKEEERQQHEREAIKKSKELRVAKLRAQQEKAQDKRMAQDEFKAKKAFETNEKAMRQKEADDRTKKREMMETIDRERKQQEAFKAAERDAMVAQERLVDHVAHCIEQENHAKRMAARAREQEAHATYIEKLNQQFQDNAMRRKNKAALETNENAAQVKKAAKEAIIVDKIRRDAIQKLEKQGVPADYLRPLQKLHGRSRSTTS